MMQARNTARAVLSVWCFAAQAILLPVRLAAQAPNYPSTNSNRGTQGRSTGVEGAGMGGMRSPDSMSDLDSPLMVHRREAARKDERKRRMVDSANRLLQLTQQLRMELATREATADDVRRLDEIAKLARSVKDQMRD